MNTCGKCKHFKECWDHTKDTHPCVSFEIEPERTNFDNVTESPEKLLEYATGIMFHDSNECRYTGKLKCPNMTCKECVLDWFKQKAEEDD